MRLIDVEHIPYECGFDNVYKNKYFIFGIEMMQKWIREQPIVDAVPVTHGEWKVTPMSGTLWCTACNRIMPNWMIETPYCPLCGAKMGRKG